MIRRELVKKLVERLAHVEFHKTVAQPHASIIIDTIVKIIMDEVAAGGTVKIKGFGIFERQHRASRPGRNPRTGEQVLIKERQIPVFRASHQFRKRIIE